MNSNLTRICYRGETGKSDLRTLILGEILYISLRDVLVTLNKENREINADYSKINGRDHQGSISST